MGMREVRDHINEPAIRGSLMADPGDRWDRVCTAMDVLSQGGPLADRIDAANTLAAEAGIQVLPGDADDADVTDAIAAIERGLDHRHRSLRQAFAKRPLSPAFSASDVGYALEKVGAVASGHGSDQPMALGGAAVLEKMIVTLRDGMNQRGYDGDEETQTALYVLERVRAYVGDEVGAPVAADLDVMTRAGLPSIVSKLTELAIEIDAEDRSF
jgi:hypothetical protein